MAEQIKILFGVRKKGRERGGRGRKGRGEERVGFAP